MRIRRGDLFQDIEIVQRQMEQLFHDMVGHHGSGSPYAQETWRPATDVYETAAGLVVRIELAGMREGDIEVVLDEKTLLVSGYRPENKPRERISYYQMGVNYGQFHLQIFLPWPVDEDSVSASYEDGFLEIRLPRREHADEPGRRVGIPVQEE
jgi:HSP20 family protein